MFVEKKLHEKIRITSLQVYLIIDISFNYDTRINYRFTELVRKSNKERNVFGS